MEKILSLPQDCLLNILTRATPADACRFSLISSTFRSIAESDDLWIQFLPPDYKPYISSQPYDSTMKALYFRLCDTLISIEGDSKRIYLEKSSGKKCLILGSRSLIIVWSDTPYYWVWEKDSRFYEVAELVNVCWLEIRGTLTTGMLSPCTKYVAYFVYRWDTYTSGFSSVPVEFAVRLGNGECLACYLVLESEDGGSLPYVRKRGDGWLEVEVGEFFYGLQSEMVEISVMEVKAGYWKSGLIVGGFEIKPKSLS